MREIGVALLPDETLLVGSWELTDNRVLADKTCNRIDRLVNGILEHVADHPKHGAWESLFRDPRDGRLWERFYPQGDLHGGGPPTLRWLNAADAQEKYCFPPGS